MLSNKINKAHASIGCGIKPYTPTSVTMGQRIPTSNILQRYFIYSVTETYSVQCLKRSKLWTVNSDWGLKLTIHLLLMSWLRICGGFLSTTSHLTLTFATYLTTKCSVMYLCFVQLYSSNRSGLLQTSVLNMKLPFNSVTFWRQYVTDLVDSGRWIKAGKLNSRK